MRGTELVKGNFIKRMIKESRSRNRTKMSDVVLELVNMGASEKDAMRMGKSIFMMREYVCQGELEVLLAKI